MPKPTAMEIQAIKTISSKKTQEMMKEAHFQSSFILSLYHMTGRKGRLFDDALKKAIENSKEVLDKIEKVEALTKRQLEKYEELKKSVLLNNLKKEMVEEK